jgi:PAS domain S-box-containing protein
METVPPSRLGLDALSTEQRLKLLVDGARDYAIYLLDPTGIVSSWNTGAERFKGYSAGEIIGHHFSRFYTEEDREAGRPEIALRTAMETGTFEAEGWRVRKDGTRFWTSVVIDPIFGDDGDLVGFAKITRDIGHKRDAERALFESEQQFRLLVQGIRDYAIYMLDPEGHVTNWNAGAQAIKGYDAGEIVGHHFSRFYTDADRDSGLPARAMATALREGSFQGEGWRVRKDGTRFWASVVIDPIRNDAGDLVGYAKITRDVTERRLAQEEIDRSREALAQAQKMEAIGRLTGGVAHDFNNLLTVIRASADLLRKPDLDPARRARYVEAIADTADRAAVLTGQLLAFARRQPLQPEVFDIAERIAGLEHILATTVGSTVKVELKTPAGVGRVNADPNQFETAVLNLVINARDAMPNGGTLKITAFPARGIPAVRQHAAATGDFAVVAVEDNGTGIEPDTLLRIFEPFFTTKGVNKGTGLGLSQVYGFAKQSGGEVDVISKPGEGTVFRLYLPRLRSAVPVPPPSPARSDPPDVAAMNILLVEDNENVGRFALSLLSELGQTATWATHGRAALDILESGDQAFDMVFSDVVMPGISGIDLGKEIRRRWPALPVVLTSGYSHVLVEQGLGGFEFLQKPYSAEGLLRILRANRRLALEPGS